MTGYDYTFKIMMLGEKSTQKTSLTVRYISGFYLEDLKLTIGVDFYSKTISFRDKKIKLQFWDFGGEERFRFLLSQYCKGANAAMMLYDITSPRTLTNLSTWIELIRQHAGNIPIILLGVKLDLEEHRVITPDEGIQLAKCFNLSGFAEVSAKTGQNVESVYNFLIELLYERYSPQSAKNVFKITEIEWRPKSLLPEDSIAY